MPRRVDDHLGDHRLDELEAGDRDAELLPLLRVVDRRVDAAVADADAAGRHGVAAEVEGAHRDLEAVADLAEDARRREPRPRRARATPCRRSEARACRGSPGTRSPAVSVGTRKQARPRCAFSGSVWAKTSATFATLPSEIHIFWPLIRQPPSIRSARVLIDAASEPESGSVRPKHPKSSPLHRPGRYLLLLLFGSPALDRAADQRVWTEITVRAALSARPICSTIRA